MKKILIIAALFALSAYGAEKPKYLSPSVIVCHLKQKVFYVACETASCVLVVDVKTAEVKGRIELPKPPTGLAVQSYGKMLYVTTASPDGEVYGIDTESRKITTTLKAGHTPMSPVISLDGTKLYVGNRFSNTVSAFDLKTNKPKATIEVKPGEPCNLALTRDGKTLIVANRINGEMIRGWTSARVTLIDTVTDKIVKTIPILNGTTNVRQIVLSGDGKWAYIPYVLSRYDLPLTAIERAWQSSNALAIIDVKNRLHYTSVLLDDVDLGAADPWGATLTADHDKLIVTHAGTHEISIIDLEKLHEKVARVAQGKKAGSHSSKLEDLPNDLVFLAGIRRRVKLNGTGPRGVAIFGPEVFITEYFSDAMSVVNMEDLGKKRIETRSVSLGPEIEPDPVRKGEKLFNDAYMAFQRWHSCATCHPDGRQNGMIRDLMNDGIGNPKSIKSLLHANETPPSMLRGIRANAEITVKSKARHVLFSGIIREKETADILAYIKSLKPVPSPYLVNGKLSESASRGKKVFEGDAGCSKCHSGRYFTDMKMHDVGTNLGGVDKGKEYDTPTLIEVWRTPPYLGHGRAGTIMEVLSKFSRNNKHGDTWDLSSQQLQDLAKYVLSL